jgi:hypothetical protein
MTEIQQRGQLAKPGAPSCRMSVREMPDIICDLEPHDKTIQHRDLHGRTWDWSKLDVHAGPRVYQTLASTEVSIMPEDMQDRRNFTITIARTSPGRFAIRWLGDCLSRDREWEYEHIPSERRDDWLETHRFGYDEALKIAREMAPTLAVNGRTVQDWMAFVRSHDEA